MLFMVNAQENTIPSWIKNTAKFWIDEQVTDIEFINALEYMINNNIINVPSQNKINEDLGDFFVKYNPNPNSIYEYSAKSWIEDSKYFETNIEFLNSMFSLPQDVEISLQECNESNAFYDLDTKQIIICYEFIDTTYAEFSEYYSEDITEDQISIMTLDVIDFIFYHELGHALIDLYQLPVTGLEENAVDQFAILFILLAEDIEDYEGIVGQDILYNVGTWFLIQSEIYAQSFYSDVHNLDIQRFYNISCYAYGHSPEYNQDLIDEGFLPIERSINCSAEYEQISRSWETILSPYMK